jgi:hypothetical protein
MAFARIVSLIATLALLGCAEEGANATGPGWAKRGGTLAGLQKDADECERAAILVPVTYRGPASGAAERRRRYDDCMNARGWTLDPHASGNAAKQIVSCKLPSVEQVQRLTAGDCHNRYGKILEGP